MAPLVTVVVPIYNVEEYLRACLESIRFQTLEDLEVIMVNDGSTDGSAAIAEEFAAADPRFKLVTRENGGLSAARNTGADHATGEYLGFVDSDDVIPRDAYELLVTPLQETGSDFATGNVHRLMHGGVTPARFLARAFDRTRLKTHVTKFRPLLVDRIVPNKLWRRSFWEGGGYRFPEGVLHEDIPVVLPAHFAARSVDVIHEPVYYYRVREGADLSITQRRLETRALIGRVDAVEHVQDYLAREGPRRAKGWYEESVVAEDLRYYLDVLDGASDEYRQLFLDRVNAFLDRCGRGVYRDLSAIERLKWHLVRRRLMPELLQVLRFQKERMRETPPVRVGRRWYGDYPFRTDPDLKIPKSVYRLREELVVAPRVDDLHFDGEELKIGGFAFIAGLGAPTRDSQRVTVTVVRRGRLLRVRMRTSAIRLRARAVQRPEATAMTSQASADVQWSGFEATLPPRKLRSFGRWRPGTWDLYVTVRAGGVTRRRSRFWVDSPRPVRAVDCELSDGMSVKASPAVTGEIAVHVEERWGRVLSHRVADGVVELRGRSRGTGDTFRLARPGSQKLEYPVERESGSPDFRVSMPLADVERALASADPEPQGSEYAGQTAWNLWLVGAGAPSTRLSLEEHAHEGIWPLSDGERELALVRGKDGDAALLARGRLPLVDEAHWTDDGELELSGDAAGFEWLSEILVVGRLHIERQPFPVSLDGGRFRVRLTPGHVESLAGVRPLQEGTWDLYARAGDGSSLVRVMLSQELFDDLPLRAVVAHKTVMLACTPQLQAVLIAHRDLDEETERGRFHQKQLRERAYAPGRGQPLRDAVLFSSFAGRQFSDSPRALHEELVRRGTDLEQLWVVSDGRAVVPPTATVIRSASRDYYEALATARFVVVNGFFPEWFVRRPDQVVVQTFQGTPLKRVGLDVPHLRSTMRRSWRWTEQMEQWQYVVSGSRASTPILRQAYGLEGEVLEIGLPRNDLLSAPERASEAVRSRLGIAAGARVILYAPTYRDQVVDRRGRYRLDQHLDVERVMGALDSDSYLLIRKHPLVADAVETGGHPRVRDVSLWPDATELLAAANVFVTDYSALAFDFAITGRPILFFTYDLDTFSEIRGFYVDLENEAPGPLLRNTDELADALREIPAGYDDRYRAWRERWCEFEDGRVSARIVDRLFRV